MNSTLESMARALFRSWFVDFDPVRAKMEGRPTGLPEDVAALFPSRLADTPLGRRPHGWPICRLEELVDLTKGVSYKGSDLRESRTGLVNLKCMARGGGYRSSGLKAYAGPYKAEQVVVEGDIVIAQTDLTQKAEVIGRPAMILPSTDYGPLVISLDLVAVRSRKGMSREFLYELLASKAFNNHALGYTNGTTVLHLNSKALPSFELAVPPREIVNEFSEIVRPIFARRATNESQSNTLTALRDTLLPKLLSGELRVPADAAGAPA